MMQGAWIRTVSLGYFNYFSSGGSGGATTLLHAYTNGTNVFFSLNGLAEPVVSQRINLLMTWSHIVFV
jgi:hypothetical protein